MTRRPACWGMVIGVVSLLVGTTGLVGQAGPGAGCASDAGWSALILEHVERYPAMEVVDLYKLLHQATLGSEHAVRNRDEASSWLESEIAALGDGPVEAVVDRIGSRFARVHLRPFLTGGGDAGRLLDSFVKTANDGHAGVQQLECGLAVAAALAATGRLPWTAADVAGYATDRAGDGFAAVHHSDGFRDAYRPAYRVISVDLVEETVKGIREEENDR